jgi:hypothetical protein
MYWSGPFVKQKLMGIKYGFKFLANGEIKYESGEIEKLRPFILMRLKSLRFKYRKNTCKWRCNPET